MKYILYATSENGNGYIHKIGEFFNVEDIEIRVKMFAPDVVITIEEELEKELESAGTFKK